MRSSAIGAAAGCSLGILTFLLTVAWDNPFASLVWSFLFAGCVLLCLLAVLTACFVGSWRAVLFFVVVPIALFISYQSLIRSPPLVAAVHRTMIVVPDLIGMGYVTASERREVEALSGQNGAPAMRLWQLPAKGSSSKPTFVSLLYDASDEINRPPDQRSEAWKNRLADARSEITGNVFPMNWETDGTVRWVVSIIPLRHHFYFIEETYDRSLTPKLASIAPPPQTQS